MKTMLTSSGSSPAWSRPRRVSSIGRRGTDLGNSAARGRISATDGDAIAEDAVRLSASKSATVVSPT